MANGTPRFKAEVYEDEIGGWRWRVVQDNGRVVADSGEGYVRRANAVRAFRSFHQNMAAVAEWREHEGPLTARSVGTVAENTLTLRP